jgi:hypothetical protein
MRRDPVQEVLARLAERFDPTPNPYAGRPVAWTEEKLREWNTEDQKRIMESVVENRYTAVKSSHDTGKSRTASRIAAWWIDTHPLGEAFIVSTAPTAAQVSAILWREIARAHRKGKLPGRIVTGNNEWKHEWSPNDDELIGYGRKPADYNNVALTGTHARYMLVIIDEACGVSKPIYDAVDSIATNRHARVLAIGNPDDPASHFAKICQPGSGWNVIRIDGLRQATFSREAVAEHPELRRYMIEQGIPPSTEQIPESLAELLIDPLWVAERIRTWGVNSPMFMSKVRGEFPTIAVDALCHPHWVTLAQAREEEPRPMFGRIGVDVARYGTDHTIIVLRQGGHARVVRDIASGPVTEVAGLVQLVGQEIGVRRPTAFVDDTGVGGGVTDILEEEGYPVVPIVAGAGATQTLPNGKPRFVNFRSELMWNLREALAGPSGTGEDGWLDLDPQDMELAAQLTNIKYKINRHGQIQVESKDDMAARGLPSPDRADALSYSLAPDTLRFGSRPRKDNMITSDLLTRQW